MHDVPLTPLIGVIVSFLILLIGRYAIRRQRRARYQSTRFYFYFLGLVSLLVASYGGSFATRHALSTQEYIAICGACIFVSGWGFGLLAYGKPLALPAIVYPLFWAFFAPNLAIFSMLLSQMS